MSEKTLEQRALAALQGEHSDHPQITPIGWLSTLLATLKEPAVAAALYGSTDDPDSVSMMIIEIEHFEREAMAIVNEAAGFDEPALDAGERAVAEMHADHDLW